MVMALQWDSSTVSNLGKISNNLFSYSLKCPNATTFNKISGIMPKGLSIINNTIVGIAVQGQTNQTYDFAIRASNVAEFADMNFTITVTMSKSPVIITKPNLGTFPDGTDISIPINAFTTSDRPLYYSVDSNFPPGLSIDSATGIISGAIIPRVNNLTGYTSGWGESPWGKFPWQSGTTPSLNMIYSFSLYVSDGPLVSSQQCTIEVTGNTSPNYSPILLTESLGSAATIRAGSYYAFQFTALTYNSSPVIFQLVSPGVGFDGDAYDSSSFDAGNFAIPPGLNFDNATGWLYGTIPISMTSTQTYTFAIIAVDSTNPSLMSDLRTFSITVIDIKDVGIEWVSPSNIGTVYLGHASTLSVSAKSVNFPGTDLIYSFSGGQLPNGISILADGTISGRPSYESAIFDMNNTMFDSVFNTVYTFNVTVTDASDVFFSTNTFSLTIDRSLGVIPQENLYALCLPNASDRLTMLNILQDTDIFPVTNVYRPLDPWFGYQSNIMALIAWGLDPNSAENYEALMSLTNNPIKFYFGQYKIAYAYDYNDNPLYEVIYVELVPEVNVETKFAPLNGNLPEWMVSIQPDGTILNYVCAAPICYMKPGKGNQSLYRLKNINEYQISTISFNVDRYLWDCALSANYNTSTNNFGTQKSTLFNTTFDSNDTNFVNNVDQYSPPAPSANDKYLKYPKIARI